MITEESGLVQEVNSEVTKMNTESISNQSVSPEDSSALPKAASCSLGLNSSLLVDNETVLDFRQPPHRNPIRPSSSSNNELRQRRQNRNSSTHRSATSLGTVRDAFLARLSLDNERRRAAFHQDVRSSGSPVIPHAPLLLTRRAAAENVENPTDPTGGTNNGNIPRLFEMGFTRRHVNMALRANGGRDSMDNLVSWLLEHPLSDAEVRVMYSILFDIIIIIIISP